MSEFITFGKCREKFYIIEKHGEDYTIYVKNGEPKNLSSEAIEEFLLKNENGYSLKGKLEHVMNELEELFKDGKTSDRTIKYVRIVERAENQGWTGDRTALLINIQKADEKFNLRLDEWLESSDFNFFHDIYGIMENIKRKDFGFFLPRFAGKQ